ncbi:Retrovirus-related Pol polyprotein from transposon opus [Takifugu flavidus]|uniref:Gypsy retrotransposon integrase-like protein 1 n=1 Tax=Takifugu flavidus TaxID=433684 RepID=A0A5C6MH20_9TELE|nr:Retrovirus-related Pol polyprotein from transposon opus [Takifugu flavidus]
MEEEIQQLRELVLQLKAENEQLRQERATSLGGPSGSASASSGPTGYASGAGVSAPIIERLVVIPRDRKCPMFSGKSGISIAEWAEEVQACAHARIGSWDSSALTELEEASVPSLLDQYSSVFAANDEYEAVRLHINQLLESQVICEHSSPYASPIVLVRKKDGGLRLCVDYRLLNSKTRKDAVPLPRIEESLDALSGAHWFSTLDLASGYNQVPVAEQDRPKAAFCTPFGLFEFNRMPFGLCNAPSTFQWLMQRMFGDQQGQSLLLYLDDIIIFSSSVEQHLQRLEMVLGRLQGQGLKVKVEKCAIFQEQVLYLGHIISSQGVSTEPKKIETVAGWQRPRHISELWSFLGFASYYRRFVDGFAKMAKPLHQLVADLAGTKTKRGSGQALGSAWTPECEESFNALKSRLVSTPVLAYADFSRPFILETDASHSGVGAVLSQETDGCVRLVAYASNMSNYSSMKLEFLALKWAVTEKFREYLLGHKCIVYTDNNPLSHLQSAKLGAAEHSLQPDIQPGPMVGALQSLISILPSHSPFDLRLMQEADPLLKEVLVFWRHGSLPTSAERRQLPQPAIVLLRQWDRLVEKNRVLFRRVFRSDGGEEQLQLLLPAVLKGDTLHQLHQEHGHQGTERTTELVWQRCYWLGMSSDIKKWVQQCERCQVAKDSGQVNRSYMGHLLASRPNEILAVDFTLLEPSRNGFENVLVMTNVFSKFTVAVPTRDQRAVTVAQVLVTEWFYMYGVPSRLHSDQGRSLESGLIFQLCALYGVAKSRTTPYNPAGNVLFGYNTTPHQSTGESLFYLMFGQEPLLPIDFLQGRVPDPIPGEVQDWVVEHRARLCVAFEGAREKLVMAASKRKERHDLFVRDAPLPVGQLVYLRDHGVRGRHKIQDLWSSVVHQVVLAPTGDVVVYTVAPMGDLGGTRNVHRDMLKAVVQPEVVALSSPTSPSLSPLVASVDDSSNSDLWLLVSEAPVPSIAVPPPFGTPQASSAPAATAPQGACSLTAPVRRGCSLSGLFDQLNLFHRMSMLSGSVKKLLSEGRGEERRGEERRGEERQP